MAKNESENDYSENSFALDNMTEIAIHTSEDAHIAFLSGLAV